MTTIDKLDIGIHVQYARRTQFNEEIQHEYRLSEAGTVPAQTAVVDLHPRPADLDLLMGVTTSHAPWAYFFPPQRFFSQRRSPFAFHRIAPSLGSEEQQEADIAKLQSVKCSTPEMKHERGVLMKFFEQIEDLNDMIGFIVGRIGQFLQG